MMLQESISAFRVFKLLLWQSRILSNLIPGSSRLLTIPKMISSKSVFESVPAKNRIAPKLQCHVGRVAFLMYCA